MQAPGVRTPPRASRLGGATGLALVILVVVAIALVPWLRATSPDPFETAMASSCDKLDRAITLVGLGGASEEYTSALQSADGALGQAYEDSAAGSAQRADLAVLSDALAALSLTSRSGGAVEQDDLSAAVDVCSRY